MKRGAIVFALLLIASSSGFAQTDKGHLITPGQGIGSIKLGMSIEMVRSALGFPVFDLPRGDYEVDYWIPRDYFTVVFYTGSDAVLYGGAIVVGVSKGLSKDTSAVESYTTAEGVHVGSPAEDVRAAFGGPSTVVHGKDYLEKDYDLWHYHGRGISLYVQQDLVSRIYVCRPFSEACSIFPPALAGQRQVRVPLGF